MDENQLAQSPFSAMLGTTPPPPMASALPMTQAVTPQPLVAKPAGTAEELATRKEGWKSLLDDPNFSRAVMMAGAYLSQPRGQGQNMMGHLAGGIAMGSTAFQAGQYSDWERQQAEQKAAQSAAESSANVEATQTRTATDVARLPGVQATSDVAVATKDTQIEDAVTRLKITRNEAEIKGIEAQLKKRKADIEGSIPDEALLRAERSKVDAAILSVDEARARLAASKASTAKTTADAGQHEITLKVLQGMPEQEQKEFLTKTGRYSTHISSAGTAAQMYGSLYDNLSKTAPDDIRIKGKTREQFQLDGMTSQKSLDASTSLKNYMTAISATNLEPDPDIVSALSDLIKQGAKARAGGGGATPGTPTTSGEIKKISNPEEYSKLKKGERYIDPSGRERVKQ